MKKLSGLPGALLFPLIILPSLLFSQPPNDWENPQKVSENTLPPHAWFVPYPSEQAAMAKKESPLVHSLDGRWKFHLADTPAERPDDFFRDGYDLTGWDEIKVPASWQTEGFDTFIFTDVEYPIPPNPPFVPADFNPVGSYRRSFTVPAGWSGKDVILRFGAVNSFFYCWVNGRYVGMSKDSKTPAEFDITALLRKGENTLSVQVFRWSDGTYLEGQDMWKLCGIERSVWLMARSRQRVEDFFLRAGLDDTYTDGTVSLDLSLHRPATGRSTGSLEIKILDETGQTVFSQKEPVSEQQEFHLETRLPAVSRWTAETPHLYTLIINYQTPNGAVSESIAHRFGFRRVEVRHGLLLINGVAIKIKGTNRHEHNMITGKVVSEADMLRDLRVMKQFNINAVRTSHYPNAERWYELCDQYGIYVIDEANIECDGMDFHPLKTLSDKPEWREAYLDRTRRMVERDKNFTCIIGWSLGNESRWGDNFVATHDWIKSRDRTRTVQYEEARENPYTDIVCPMYKSLHVLQEYVREHRSRPLILCEYAHMMGNSGGNLKDDWDLIYRYPQLQGGFIWDFADNTFLQKDAAGRDIWAYGRDMGRVGATSDTSFCADGAFAADRSPHPQAFELQKVYQNIAFEPIDFSSDKIRIINRFAFTNLAGFEFSWTIKADGRIVASGKLPPLTTPPGQSEEAALSIPVFARQPGVEYFLWLEAFSREDAPLLPKGTRVAWEQWRYAVGEKADGVETPPAAPLSVQETAAETRISWHAGSVAFDKATGWLSSFRVGANELLLGPIQPHFWRAATDNDIGNSQQIRCAIWQQAGQATQLTSFAVTPLGEQVVEVRAVYRIPPVNAGYEVGYTITGSGEVRVEVYFRASADDLPELPRFGMRLLLRPEYDRAAWLGRGPFDNYCDRKYAAAVDVYRMPVDSLFHPYPRAQESGYRTDVRWMTLTRADGLGLMARGEPLLSAGALHFDYGRLDFDRTLPVNRHGGSMTNDPLIWWNLDLGQMGVGGDNSWGAKPLSPYWLPYQDYRYSFTLRGVGP